MAFADQLGLMFRIRAENREAIQAMRGTQTEIEKTSRTAKDSFKGAQQSTEGLGSSLLSLRNLMGGAVVSGFLSAAKAGVQYKDTLDKLTISFTSLLGSTQEATKHLKELQDFAAATPFEFLDVAKASQRFQNMGIAAKDVIPLLTAVGNAVAATGGGSEQVDKVSLALTQMLAKGKVSAQEMNQLSENLVGGWAILEKQLGKSKAEVIKLAEEGKISADTFVKAFRQQFEAGEQMTKQMGTLGGAMSTLKDNTLKLLSEAFTPLHEQLRLLTLGAVQLTNQLNKTGTEGKNAGLSIQDGFLKAVAAFILFRSELSTRSPIPTVPNATDNINIGKIFTDQQEGAVKKRLDEQLEVIKGITLIQQGIANVEAELAKQAQEAAEKNLDRARDALQQATIAVQNYGKSEGEAAENTLKWATGLRQLSQDVNQRSLPDLIRLTKLQVDHLQALEGQTKFTKELQDLVKSFQTELHGEETALQKVNTAVREYLAAGGPLNHHAIALETHARQLASVIDQWNEIIRLSKLADTIKVAGPTAGVEGVRAPGAADTGVDFTQKSIWEEFKSVATGAMGEVTSAGQAMFDIMSSGFAGLTQGMGQVIFSFLMGEKITAKAFAAMAKAAIASVAAEAAVRALFELAMFFATLWLKPQEAASHLLAAKTFGVVAGLAAGAALAIPGGGGASSAGASGLGFNGGTSFSQESERDRTRREPRAGGAPDPNQPVIYVYLTAKTEPGVMLQTLKTEYRRQTSGFRDLLRQDLLGEASG